jgi:hypothetical protein
MKATAPALNNAADPEADFEASSKNSAPILARAASTDRSVACERISKSASPEQAANLVHSCGPRAAVLIEPVSADSLPKTGIFAEKAGDF